MLETLICSAAITISSLVGVTRPAATSAVPGTLPAAAMAKDEKHPVIVHIVSRDQTITVKTSRGGMLYSLTAIDGKILIADATADKFAELQPQLFQQIRRGMAVQADNADVLAIGSVDR